MAKENVKKFYEELKNNKELREKLLKAQENYEGDKSNRQEAAEAIFITVAKEAGFDFTVQELKDGEQEISCEKGISEEELENVSGGVNGCYFIGFGTEPSAGATGINNFHACCFVGIGTDFEF